MYVAFDVPVQHSFNFHCEATLIQAAVSLKASVQTLTHRLLRPSIIVVHSSREIEIMLQEPRLLQSACQRLSRPAPHCSPYPPSQDQNLYLGSPFDPLQVTEESWQPLKLQGTEKTWWSQMEHPLFRLSRPLSPSPYLTLGGNKARRCWEQVNWSTRLSHLAGHGLQNFAGANTRGFSRHSLPL